jgi:flagellar M-ring protein FliF
MDFLNKAVAQLSELFRSMTPGARLTAGLLLVAVVVSLGYLFRYEVSGADVYLMNGEPISADELNNMTAAFGKAGLKDFEIQGSKIRVPHGQQAAYMGALADAKALPAGFRSSFRRMIDNGNIFLSDKDREERLRIAIQENLSLWISKMTGIEAADVMIDTETKTGFGHEPVKTASVSVQAAGSEPIKESQVDAICCLVSGAVAGLKPESVIVTDLKSSIVHRGTSESGGPGGNAYLTLQRRYEEDYQRKILHSLSFIPNLTVQTSVQLNREKVNRVWKMEPTKPVVIEHKEKSSTHNHEGSGATGGRPGYQTSPNQPASLAGQGQKGSHEEGEDSESEDRSMPGTTQMEMDTVGLTPESVRVTVGIPNNYFEKVWRERNPTPAGQEAKPPDQAALEQVRNEESIKIQKHVAALLPPVKGVTDLTELVTVTSFQDITPGPIPLPGTGQKIGYWLAEYWSTLGLIALAAGSLVVLRSMVRGAAPGAPESTTAQVRVAAEPEPRENESAEAVAARRLRRFSGSGPSLRDELSEMVSEDPDAAANILRSWIGNVT